MQILPILNSGDNKLSMNSAQSVNKGKESGFADLLKTSKLSKHSFEYSGQENAFSRVFAKMDSGSEQDINAGQKEYSRTDAARTQENISGQSFDSSNRENIAHTSGSRWDREDRQRYPGNNFEDSANRTSGDLESKEETTGISEKKGNNRDYFSTDRGKDREDPEMTNQKKEVSSEHEIRAMQDKDAQEREKLAKAVDMLQQMGVKREEIEKALKSLEDIDLEDMQDLSKLVMQLLQEKLKNADMSEQDMSFMENFLQSLGMDGEEIEKDLKTLEDGQDMSFMENFLQSLGMDGEKLQKALNKLDSGKEQEFLKFLQNFLQDRKANTDIDVKKQDLMKLLQALDLSSGAEKGLRDSIEQLDNENMGRRNLTRILDRISQNLESGKEITDNKNFSLEFKNWLKNQGLTEQEINKLEQMVQKNTANSKSEKSIQQALQNLQSGNQNKKEEISQLKEAGKNNTAQGEKGALNQAETARHAGKGKSSEASFLQRVQQVKTALENGAGTNNSGSGGKEREGSSAWKEMWGKINNNSTSRGTNNLNAGQNMQDKANSTMQQILGKNSGSGKLSQNQEMRANVLKQVQNGMLKNLNQGGKELTMRLHPPHLGKLNVTLQVRNQEVSALIKSTSAEVAKMIHNQMAELKHVLEQQGLRVQKLDVQTQVPQEDASKHWFSQDEHNQGQDRREQMEKRSMRNHWLAREDEEDMAQSLQNGLLEEKNSVSAISVIA